MRSIAFVVLVEQMDSQSLPVMAAWVLGGGRISLRCYVALSANVGSQPPAPRQIFSRGGRLKRALHECDCWPSFE